MIYQCKHCGKPVTEPIIITRSFRAFKRDGSSKLLRSEQAVSPCCNATVTDGTIPVPIPVIWSDYERNAC